MQDFISTTNSSNQSAAMNQQFSPLFSNSTWTTQKYGPDLYAASLSLASLASVDGSSNNDVLRGNGVKILSFGAQDELFGGAGGDFLDAGDGDDRLFGEGGKDWLLGRSGQDQLWGGLGGDYLDGGDGDDRLYGEAGRDWLLGGDGQDQLFGGDGTDILNGNQGDNRLTGGKGSDVFVIGRSGKSWVEDFQVGVDLLALDGLTFEQLRIFNQNGEAWITTLDNQPVAFLKGVDAGLLGLKDFADVSITTVLGNVEADWGKAFEDYQRNGGFGNGAFTVGQSGQVSIDYLFDGSGYEGQLAIFSLTGMEGFLQGDPDGFMQEVARRALSNSGLGHTVIFDAVEGARFSGEVGYEGNFNAGQYLGAKAFSMRPGEKFAVMLVPNGKVADVRDNGLGLGDGSTPMFSIASLNLGRSNQLVQLVDVKSDELNPVDSNVFAFEDLYAQNASSRDFNDVIFQIRNADGKAPLLKQTLELPAAWESSAIGQKLIQYATLDGKGLTGRYYNNSDFTGYRGRRTDVGVNFDWQDGAPKVMSSPDSFSIRWTGQVEAQHSETYTFYTQSDEKVRLWVNGQLLIDNWVNHLKTEDSGQITLVAGQKYDIKLEYAEETGNAEAKLLWSSATQPKEVIPHNLLYPGVDELPVDQATGLEYRPGKLLVKLNSGITDEQARSLSQINGILGFERLIPQRVGSTSPLEQWRIFDVASNTNLSDMQKLLLQSGIVALAGFDYRLEVDEAASSSDIDIHKWNNLDQIKAPEAWSLQKRKKPITVAVIDTGVDYKHSEFKDRMWLNSKETLNGVDDDGNGYIDDIYGYDFGSGDSNPMDDGTDVDKPGHGTHVAGTVAGTTVGVSPNAKIMALKARVGINWNFTSSVVQAIDYAVANGARVINASWSLPDNFWTRGGIALAGFLGDITKLKDIPSLAAIIESIEYANNAQVLFVATAYNDRIDIDDANQFPGGLDLPNVITVTSTDKNDILSRNYGKTRVDLGAPGEWIYSSIPGGSIPEGPEGRYAISTPEGNYALKSGTSMAAPHVAGAAAILLGENDSLTAAQLRQILMDSGDPRASLKDKTVSGKRLNVANALRSLPVQQRGVKVTINRVKQVDILDGPSVEVSPIGLLLPKYDPADFYPYVSIGNDFYPYGETEKFPQVSALFDPSAEHFGGASYIVEDEDDIRPNWRFSTKEISGDTVDICIAILESDGGARGKYDIVDINPLADKRILYLQYDLNTGELIDQLTQLKLQKNSDGQYDISGAFDNSKGRIWFTVETLGV